MEKSRLAEQQAKGHNPSLAGDNKSTQAENEAMSLGSLVGRNEIKKPWYAKSKIPA